MLETVPSFHQAILAYSIRFCDIRSCARAGRALRRTALPTSVLEPSYFNLKKSERTGPVLR